MLSIFHAVKKLEGKKGTAQPCYKKVDINLISFADQLTPTPPHKHTVIAKTPHLV